MSCLEFVERSDFIDCTCPLSVLYSYNYKYTAAAAAASKKDDRRRLFLFIRNRPAVHATTEPSTNGIAKLKKNKNSLAKLNASAHNRHD